MLTNGSAPYWAGSQLYPRPIGERLLVSWQSGVPAPRRSGFVWVLGGGPGCRGPRWRLASGRGSGIAGPERGEGRCVERGPRRPRPRPLVSPFQPGAPLECHPAPPRPSHPRPTPGPGLPGPTPTPVAALLTPSPCLECESVSPLHASEPHPALGELGQCEARVCRSRGSRSHPLPPSGCLPATFLGVLRIPITHPQLLPA